MINLKIGYFLKTKLVNKDFYLFSRLSSWKKKQFVLKVLGMNLFTQYQMRDVYETLGINTNMLQQWMRQVSIVYRRCHEKTSKSNYVFFTLLHKWVDRG